MAVKVGIKNENVNVGPKWAKGDPGGYYTPSVSEEGNLSWLPSEEDMPEVPEVNIKGSDGAAGPQGEKGESGVYVGSTEPEDDSLIWINPDGSETTGAFVPGGGSTGQVLAKESDSDYDTGWIDPNGKSAYEIAVDNGFVGTEKEWLDSLSSSVTPISNMELEELLK